MDTKDVKLNIILNYDGKKYEKRFTYQPSLEKIKNMSKQVFVIEDDIFNVTMYNNKDKKPKSIIKSDEDLMQLMKEIDEYHYEINLELSFDKTKTNKQWQEIKEGEIKEGEKRREKRRNKRRRKKKKMKKEKKKKKKKK